MTDNATQITERLASSETGMQPWLWLPLMRLLAQGDPVDIGDLAATTGRPVDEVRSALAAMADTEYDGSGRIIGQGLTQRATPHRFEIDGEQLYTWCALDTLIFPTILGTSAVIESRYRTGTPVRVTVDSSGVRSVEPATAVVSLVAPDDMRSVRSSFCNQVHFFASPEEAEPWLADHRDGSVIPVTEAFALGSSMAEKMLAETAADRPTRAASNSCC